MSSHCDIIAIVLAAGKGKRMKSDLPKVLHLVAGKPLITYLTDTLESMNLHKVVLVVGHGRESVQSLYLDSKIAFAIQQEQRGTADAVKAASEHFRGFAGGVMVINGDVPLLKSTSLERLITEHVRHGNAATILTSFPPDPGGYGRVMRDHDGRVKKIVEDADANSEELQVREINTGIYLFDARTLSATLDQVDRNNIQGEYYLTAVVQLLLREGKTTGAVVLDDYREGLGVNSAEQLRELERAFFELKR